MAQQLFVPTGSMETFVVPPHQPGTLRVTVAGAQGGRYPAGGSTDSRGGRGGSIRGYVDLPSGTNVSIAVGWMGEDGGRVTGVPTRPQGGGVAGWRGGDGGAQAAGGGPVSAWSGAGGGGTAVLLSGAPLIVAGGGGGGALKSSLTSGNEGGRGGLGIAAGEYTAPTTGQNGEGGQLDRPGVGGAPHSNLGANGNPGGDGSGGNGGNGADGHPGFASNNGAGAGGGGGYYGAGGSGGGWLDSTHGRGGGGSSWGDTTVLTGVDHVGYQTGDGYVLFEWEEPRGIYVGPAVVM